MTNEGLERHTHRLSQTCYLLDSLNPFSEKIRSKGSTLSLLHSILRGLYKYTYINNI